MPPFETFCDAESHAAVLAHELTHAMNIASACRATWPQAFWRRRYGEGGISCGARRPRRCRPLYSRPCSPCAKITGPPASGAPQSAIASRAYSPCWSGAVENRPSGQDAECDLYQPPRVNDCSGHLHQWAGCGRTQHPLTTGDHHVSQDQYRSSRRRRSRLGSSRSDFGIGLGTRRRVRRVPWRIPRRMGPSRFRIRVQRRLGLVLFPSVPLLLTAGNTGTMRGSYGGAALSTTVHTWSSGNVCSLRSTCRRR
jgi:hypothetical protein